MNVLEIMYESLLNTLENPLLPPDASIETFDFLESNDFKKYIENSEHCENILNGIKYWRECLNKIMNAKNEGDICNITNNYLAVNNEFVSTHYDLIQAISKATIHQLWRKLYALKNKTQKYDKQAMFEAIDLYRKICDRIAIERGFENGEELMNYLSDH